MFLAMDTPFKLGAQFRRPNQGYAVDNLKNNFTFYMPVRRGMQTRNHNRSCTFPSIKKHLPFRQILLQDHFDGENPFVYSLEGKKITWENKKRSPGSGLKCHSRTMSTCICYFAVYYNKNVKC